MYDLRSFSNVKVLVVGDIMVDQYWWGSVSRISPEAPVPVVRLTKTSLAAGGAANVAANVAGLGAEKGGKKGGGGGWNQHTRGIVGTRWRRLRRTVGCMGDLGVGT